MGLIFLLSFTELQQNLFNLHVMYFAEDLHGSNQNIYWKNNSFIGKPYRDQTKKKVDAYSCSYETTADCLRWKECHELNSVTM